MELGCWLSHILKWHFYMAKRHILKCVNLKQIFILLCHITSVVACSGRLLVEFESSQVHQMILFSVRAVCSLVNNALEIIRI